MEYQGTWTAWLGMYGTGDQQGGALEACQLKLSFRRRPFSAIRHSTQSQVDAYTSVGTYIYCTYYCTDDSKYICIRTADRSLST